MSEALCLNIDCFHYSGEMFEPFPTLTPGEAIAVEVIQMTMLATRIILGADVAIAVRIQRRVQEQAWAFPCM
jgi:hypothetical protein